MVDIAQSERAALCELFLEVGPDAATLCEGWTAADLASHLVVRERNPLAGLGIVFPPLASVTDKAMAREKEKRSWEDLVGRVRSGPPFGPMRLFDEQFNAIEFFVHHEDVRRGDGDTGPRADLHDVDARLWSMLGRGARLFTRSLKGTGLELARPDGEVLSVRSGDATARLTGTPGELTLYVYGRKDAAVVDLGGDADAVAAVEAASLGA